MNNERKRLGEWTKAGGKAAAATEHVLKEIKTYQKSTVGCSRLPANKINSAKFLQATTAQNV
jgi:hypothetical protein